MFEQKLGLARTVFPYVENHNFYIEHWSLGVFWRKMRELNALFIKAGFWSDPDGLFYLIHPRRGRRCGITAAPGVSAARRPGRIIGRSRSSGAERSSTLLRTQKPAAGAQRAAGGGDRALHHHALGHHHRSHQRLAERHVADTKQLTGMAASPGTVEGPARVIRSADELDQVQDGEILVTPVTAPSWAPVFSKIKATVTDIGGMMSHAAIVCREYGLPAVTLLARRAPSSRPVKGCGLTAQKVKLRFCPDQRMILIQGPGRTHCTGRGCIRY